MRDRPDRPGTSQRTMLMHIAETWLRLAQDAEGIRRGATRTDQAVN